MSRLKSKVIIITGGNGLIGKEVVLRLKSEGATCVNIDINQHTTSDLSNINCDITNFKSIDDAIELIIKKYNKIDGLVNNAYPRTKDWGNKFEEIEITSWQNNIDWQLNSYFYFMQKVSRHMINKEYGSIVNIASVYGIVGPDFTVYEGTDLTMPAAYSVIKGGLINFTRYLASYLGPKKIRVNCVSPGGIFDNQNPIFIENYNKKVPMKRMGLPKDISPTIAFLLSDDSSYITGQNIAIDGGWTAI